MKTLRPRLGRRGELSGGGQQEQQTRGVQQGAADDKGTRDNHWQYLVNKLLCAPDRGCRVRAPAAAGHPAGGPPGVRGLQRRGGGRPARRGQVQAAGRRGR